MRGIVRRIRNLEQRSAPSEAERLPGLPIWWLTQWEEYLGAPVDEYGRPKFAAIKRDQPERRAVADSMSARTEDSRTADATAPSGVKLRFD